MSSEITPFTDVYHLFDSKVTDDMFMEMDEEDTKKEMYRYLIQAINWFEFPRHDLYDFTITQEQEVGSDIITTNGYFNSVVTIEEQNILATYMLVAWFTQQIASVDNTRLKYSGSDFKFTSQANHISKLNQLKKDYEREGFHLQRLYGRRNKDTKKNKFYSTFGDIMESSIGERSRRLGY